MRIGRAEKAVRKQIFPTASWRNKTIRSYLMMTGLSIWMLFARNEVAVNR